MNYFVFLLILVIATTGCDKTLKHPENVDPIYMDLKKDAEAALQRVRLLQGFVAKAKKEYENAPIRTGQRQDAADDYYELAGKLQKAEENYRYLAVRTLARFKESKKLYERSLEEKLSWPLEGEFDLYLAEKRLKAAPREWDPAARIKARAIASEKTSEKPKEGEGSKSEAHH